MSQGFDFSLAARNAFLDGKGIKQPNTMKTGTTIVGIRLKDCVILGADTRATKGSTVADKNCEKLHYLAPNIYCAGAGTAADAHHITRLISKNLGLHRLESSRPSRVVTAMTMLRQRLFRHMGHIQAALVLGGYDPIDGPSLLSISPHGSVHTPPFVTMGSGSLCAMSVFERGYANTLTEEEGVQLVKRAILSGIINDMGSGSNVDVCVIRGIDDITYMRNVETPVRPRYQHPTPLKLIGMEIVSDETRPVFAMKRHEVPAAPVAVDENEMEGTE
ncbi:hypothetical protein PCE1_004748 [Barthelona sp. PCE]